MSRMAGDGDVLYGRRRLLTLVQADGIQSYLCFHIYTGLVALLDRIQFQASLSSLFQQNYGFQFNATLKCIGIVICKDQSQELQTKF